MKKKTLTVFKRLEAQRHAVIKFYNRLTPAQRQFSPGPGRWNLLQVMKHLVTAEKQSLSYIRRKLTNPKVIPHAGAGAFVRHQILKLALMLPLKFKAPKIARVKEEYPDFESLKTEWDNVRAEMKTLLDDCDDEMLSKAVYNHPRAGMLNVKQALEFFEIHTAHHQKQINRIMNHSSFPG